MTPIFSPDAFLNPQLDASAQEFLRACYGILLIGTLALALPQWRRFFVSEHWGGYAQSSPDVNLIQNPVCTFIVGIVWFACATLLVIGQWTVWAAFINLLICRYFFIQMRWKSITRGLGAPGFFTYWLGAAVFLLELTSHCTPALKSLALLVLQADFALIMFSAGIYKLTAGYARNHGMELGLVNPEWGYWWQFWRRIPPSSSLFKILNQLAWSTEVVAAILMLIPATRFIGGLLILFSFIFIATQIRLGLLCEMVIVCCILFFHPGSWGSLLIVNFAAPAIASFTNVWQNVVAQNLPWANIVLAPILWAYLILLPLVHLGLFYNFYWKKSLPNLFQAALEKYTNFFGIIIWRVFSVDIVNFFILVYRCKKNSTERTLVSHYGWQGGLRYNHVAESIAITSLFTTLKYYSSNIERFNERLLRYARTIDCPPNCLLEFEYMSIRKTDFSFDFALAAKYIVDTVNGTVSEHIIDQSIAIRSAHSVSPVHEGVKPGSYVPLGG